MANIDFFVSIFNHQVYQYVSWCSYQNLVVIDNLAITWTILLHLFSLIGEILSKIKLEIVTGILIIPW